MADYEFRYSPLTGRLTGKQMIEQTEQAINQLSSLVDSAAGQVEIISALANEANENAATALETAEEALATTGRTYITVSTQTDANNYYDSQLIYIADSTSTNIPVADTGMLEVKTNDNKTACEQVFIAASSGDAYYRHGAITAETVGDVTTYTATWGGWSSQPASQTYVQQELTNYLPLSGGTVTGDLTVSGNIAGNLTGNVAGKASENLPLTGGTMTGSIVNNTGLDGIILGPSGNTGTVSMSGGETLGALDGAKLDLFGASHATNPGEAILQAGDGNGYKQLRCKPNGDITWAGYNVLTDATVGTVVSNSSNAISLASSAVKTLTSVVLSAGVWVVVGKSNINVNHNGNYGIILAEAVGVFAYDNDGVYADACTNGEVFAGITTKIFKLTTQKTIYLNAYTSGGATTTLHNFISAVRIA